MSERVQRKAGLRTREETQEAQENETDKVSKSVEGETREGGGGKTKNSVLKAGDVFRIHVAIVQFYKAREFHTSDTCRGQVLRMSSYCWCVVIRECATF